MLHDGPTLMLVFCSMLMQIMALRMLQGELRTIMQAYAVWRQLIATVRT